MGGVEGYEPLLSTPKGMEAAGPAASEAHNLQPVKVASDVITNKAQGSKVLISQKVLIKYYLTESVYNVVLQKSTPAQIRQLIHYISNGKGTGEPGCE